MMNRILLYCLTFILLSGFKASDPVSNTAAFDSYCKEIYTRLSDETLNYECFKTALTGFQSVVENRNVVKKDILTVIDYTKPSTEKRLYIIDLVNQKIILKSLVSHGMNSGTNYARIFSNSVHSHMSSLGFYLTGEPYIGSHGYSLKLEGLEKGFNSNAFKRAIVIHPAKYVCDDYIKNYGRLGRSFGCPAVPGEENQKIIDIIKENTCLFIYFPDEDYLSSSEFFKKKDYNLSLNSN